MTLFSFSELGNLSLLTISACCVLGYLSGVVNMRERPLPKELAKARFWLMMASLFTFMACLLKMLFHTETLPFVTELVLAICMSYPISRMIALGFGPVFSRDYLQKKVVIRVFLRVIVVDAALLLTHFYSSSSTFELCVMLGAICTVFLDTILMVSFIFVSYGNHVRALDNYYSEDKNPYFAWIPIMLSAVLTYIIGWIGAIAAPEWVFGVYSLIGAVLLFVMLVYWNRYFTMARYLPRNILDEEECAHESSALTFTDSDASLYVDNYTEMLQHLQRWTAEKGYCQPDINIEMLAHQLGTNRTYLSGFINAHFRMSFRVWIASMRIADAKKLLLESDSKETDICQQVGFGSMQSFIRSFVQAEGCTPSEYRTRSGKQA